MENAISIDLEDWFCTYNLSHKIKRDDWKNCESRINVDAHKLLKILHDYGTHATFFILGWIAEKEPQLINEIEDSGHEIAIHGYYHKLITQITPAEFEADLEQAFNSVEKCKLHNQIIGFRAPSFTIVKNTLWALEILEKFGFKYDSSVFPMGFHPDYGISEAPLKPYKITEKLYEFPMSCIEVFGKRIPFGGGAYFRILPYAYNRYCLNKINSLGRPAIFYIHPWELDPDQPRLKLPPIKAFRQYYNLAKTEGKIKKLLSEFKFTTIRKSLGL